MSLGLSLFSPLLLVLRWRRHGESNGKNQTQGVSEKEEGEKVSASPTASAVTHGWPSTTCRFSFSSEIYQVRRCLAVGVKFDRAGEGAAMKDSMWRFFLQISSKTGRSSWHNRECCY
ncbi:hypothetical protein ABVT39_004552 [Epinephelus coioides]